MANQEHFDILKQGVVTWNQWRKEQPDIRPNLHGADLIFAYLSHANLRGANLTDAILTQQQLNQVYS